MTKIDEVMNPEFNSGITYLQRLAYLQLRAEDYIIKQEYQSAARTLLMLFGELKQRIDRAINRARNLQDKNKFNEIYDYKDKIIFWMKENKKIQFDFVQDLIDFHHALCVLKSELELELQDQDDARTALKQH